MTERQCYSKLSVLANNLTRSHATSVSQWLIQVHLISQYPHLLDDAYNVSTLLLSACHAVIDEQSGVPEPHKLQLNNCADAI